MRKIIKKLLAATITGSILLSGCGTESNGNISESKESTPAQETVQAEKQEEKAKGGNGKTIVNFYYWDEAQKEGMDELINMFEASQDNIIVEPTIVPWGVLDKAADGSSYRNGTGCFLDEYRCTGLYRTWAAA